MASGLGAQPGGSDWPVYGGDPGGRKYSPLTAINRDNVAGLEVARHWTRWASRTSSR
jgi:quinoprotein glucose dehydrogenase